MFVIGQIVGTHGLKGEVKVKQITDFNERFKVGNHIYIQNEETGIEELEIDSSRQTNKGWLIHFKNYNSINEVEFLHEKMIYIMEQQLTNLEEHAYYFHQIIGCTVQTTKGEFIGEIDSILKPGANDVWVVKSDDGKEILIPYIEDVVIDVNVNDKIVKIKLLEGLLD